MMNMDRHPRTQKHQEVMESDLASQDDNIISPLQEFLDYNQDVKVVECIWVDYFGITRVRRLTVARAIELANTRGHLSLNPSSMATHLEGSPIPDISNPGVDRMRPDWNSLRLMGDDPSRAAVLCWYLGKEILTRHPLPKGLLQPQPPYEDEGSPGRCPRTALRRILRLGHQVHGAHFRVGFELEFYLLDEPYDPVKHNPDDSGTPESEDNNSHHHHHHQQRDRRTYWSTASSLRGKYGDCVESCVLSLEECGIPVEQFSSKSSQQQYKISLGPQEAMRAADSLILATEIIKRTALKNFNLHATFFPTPFSNQHNKASSGLHAHISIHGVSPQTCSAYLAGMLFRLPLLAVFAMPNSVSFQRHEVSEWVSWGTENRFTPVRQVKPNHWELRMVDATCNIYLVLSTAIAAGLLGIRDKAPLLWEDCRGNPDTGMDPFQRLECGINTRLPDSLETSLKILNTGSFMGLDKVLGGGMLEYYRLLRKADKHRQDQMGKVAVERFLAKEF